MTTKRNCDDLATSVDKICDIYAKQGPGKLMNFKLKRSNLKRKTINQKNSFVTFLCNYLSEKKTRFSS